MKLLFLTTAYHQHAQNIARVLHEHDALGAWLAGLVFSPRQVRGICAWTPGDCRGRLERRAVASVPFDRVFPTWRWEILRLLAHRTKVGADVEDRLWERGELAMDSRGAEWVGREFGGAVGFEHGCLATLRGAKAAGKRAIVVFASPHHATRERWVDVEYERERAWCDASERELVRRAAARDRRRDQEAEIADLVFANSPFTRDSLVSGGVAAGKAISIPLGLPAPQALAGVREYVKTAPLQVLYVGSVALHKGFHYLQRAISALKSPAVRLDVYGGIRVNRQALASDERINFHGPVGRGVLAQAYARADVLVFPTLCDGFGQVVAEAWAHGLPVICSENAGVVHFVREGVNGFRVPPGDTPALMGALTRCLDERDRLWAMREGAVQTVKTWTWKQFRETWFRAAQGGC